MKCECCSDDNQEMYAHCRKCMCGTYEIIIHENGKKTVQCSRCKTLVGEMK